MDKLTGDLRIRVGEWLRWDKNEKTRATIESLVEAGNVARLEAVMLKRLSFGTAGLRGVMGEGFACMNDLVIVQTSQGLAKYLLKTLPDAKTKGIVIGFDGRHNSARFALLAAQAFLQVEVPVRLFTRVTPTPYIPFTISHFGCAAGVMVTASHNPKDDNGYKVYWENGAQILSPHDAGIQNSILQELEPWPQAWKTESVRSNVMCSDPIEEVNSKYMEVLEKSMFDRNMNRQTNVMFTFTSMHGVSHPYITEAFKRWNFKPGYPVVEQMEPHPDFPTVKFPNPEEGKSALNLAIATANSNKSRVILANDPDADRLAVAERIDDSENFHVFSGDHIGLLLGWWMWHSFKAKNQDAKASDVYMIASTVSSKALRSVANLEGFNFEETLTGFKWMGNRGIELTKAGKIVLFAYEEAIGYMCGTSVWDKDGISAAMHVAELVAYLDSTKAGTLQEHLDRLFVKYGFHVTNNSYYLSHQPEMTKKMFNRIRNFNGPNTYPTKLGRFMITGVRDLTVGFDNTLPDNVPILPVSDSSEMITFYMANSANITIRTSGTEPKIKWYSEISAKPGTPKGEWASYKVELDELIGEMIAQLYQPEVYGFIARSG
ncbi:phosphoglucomutase-2-like isoform X1 [Varroa destructor]|uniref:Phosphoglucomutase n=1 Tax=Varroa destructor TaxID=109461 RepID=A0A7M7JWX7_VARDE|nr:phosphoglucomutase-2-like isoform X1 [Varroa destructor]